MLLFLLLLILFLFLGVATPTPVEFLLDPRPLPRYSGAAHLVLLGSPLGSHKALHRCNSN